MTIGSVPFGTGTYRMVNTHAVLLLSDECLNETRFDLDASEFTFNTHIPIPEGASGTMYFHPSIAVTTFTASGTLTRVGYRTLPKWHRVKTAAAALWREVVR